MKWDLDVVIVNENLNHLISLDGNMCVYVSKIKKNMCVKKFTKLFDTCRMLVKIPGVSTK